MAERRVFYGWPMSAVAWFIYGLGVMPFYSWGFLLPEMLEELGLSRADGGIAFGAGVLAGGIASPIVGMALTRFGSRKTMTAGFLVSSIAYFWLSQANGLLFLVLVYGVFSAFTHAFATVVPTQNLAQTWFLRYRARMLAFLLTASGIMAPIILALNAWLVANSTWRTGWIVIGGINAGLGILTYLVIRDSPESIGQLQDGAKSREELEAFKAKGSTTTGQADWTAGEASRTPQFFLMLVCGLGYAVPWYVLINHGRLHLQDLGFGLEPVAAILSAMTFISTFGRLSGALGDFISPPRLLGVALLLEATGTVLYISPTGPTLAYTAAIFVGLGFGMAYICQAATIAMFFGRRAFATTTGIRFMVGAFFTSTAPAAAGWWYDTRGSYDAAFLTVAALPLAGSIVAFLIRSPKKKEAAA